jgi:hypothetical protein
MGMFDNLVCKIPLPLPEDAVNLSKDWKEETFQTKDLDNSLSLYHITEDGSLVEEVVEREYIPYSEEELAELKKDKNKNKRLFLFTHKDVIIKNKYTKPVAHHGVINFYHVLPFSEEQDYWLGFNAYFIYGKLDKIELTESEKHKSSRLHNMEWDRKRELEEKLLWNRAKTFLNRFGWRRFWVCVARTLSKVAESLNKLQYAIYRNLL